MDLLLCVCVYVCVCGLVNYTARRYGVDRLMTIDEARGLCPGKKNIKKLNQLMEITCLYTEMKLTFFVLSNVS